MIYLYIGKHSIKLLGLSKTILGQFNPTFFTKNHSTDLIQNGNISGIDLVASAVKEALTNAQPNSVNDKEVTLILPQEAFTYGRFSIPADISWTTEVACGSSGRTMLAP
jgi:Tfp pilus assembly PilM family ATPase